MTIRAYSDELRKALFSPSGAVAVVMALLSFGGTQLVDYVKESNQTYQKLVSERVMNFIDTTKEFDALVATLANTVMDGNKPDTELKSKIYTNLNNQYADIRELSALLPKDDERVVNYRSAIQQFNSTISTINAPKDLRDYWLMLSNVLRSRNALAAELRRKANLEI